MYWMVRLTVGSEYPTSSARRFVLQPGRYSLSLSGWSNSSESTRWISLRRSSLPSEFGRCGSVSDFVMLFFFCAVFFVFRGLGGVLMTFDVRDQALVCWRSRR